MKQHSYIDIADTPEVIWPVVADAEWLAGWNEKIVSVKALGSSRPALAANYEFTFQMSKSSATTVCEATLSQFKPHELVEWTYFGTYKQKHWQVVDRFRLKVRGNQTRLYRDLDISQAPLPTWIRPLVWLVFKFGRPVGQTNLQRIKELVEVE